MHVMRQFASDNSSNCFSETLSAGGSASDAGATTTVANAQKAKTSTLCSSVEPPWGLFILLKRDYEASTYCILELHGTANRRTGG